ncbi:MAG: hypothetical protein WBA89_14720 [Microcoleus sp.]
MQQSSAEILTRLIAPTEVLEVPAPAHKQLVKRSYPEGNRQQLTHT